MRRALAAVGALLLGRSHCRLPPGYVLPSYTRGQPEGWAIASGAALIGETEAVSRATGWRCPASGPQGARAERGIRPEPRSLRGLICEIGHSRTWNPSRLVVEPILPARVEKGAWRGARLRAVPASGSPPSGCRLLAMPGTGTLVGDLGSGPKRRRCRHPTHAGGRLGGRAPEAWHPRPHRAV